ncbi:response regulator transcription factor [Mucilaginibacter limnophilus]|uniref:Response regulator transcription factor n=1 Tax=Mucilaginibacter limnophilus TaxID=1932778 RepID=A0A3S2X0X3_9SPHI|nr:LytTR family DNA-binding domain-containing protein [Mucilaginibacter limnophilus]RVU02877.1 response regulator transcription factor [Mucilaginibacter limnophilus]
MKVVIIEDELLATQYLTKLLNDTGEIIDILATLDSKAAAISFFETAAIMPDLIFMDIELGDGKSFDIIDKLNLEIPIIFITAYQEHTLKAFKLNSIDYLLKPINADELTAALLKFKKHHLNGHTGNISNLLRSIKHNTPTYRNRYLAKLGTRLISVDASMIAYFYVHERFQYIKTTDGKDYIIDKRMDAIETDIDPTQFFRVNRQFLLSYSSIKKVHTWFGGKLKIEVEPSAHAEIVVGRLRVNEFKKWLGE